jgi:Bacterial DNA topoisomerase IB, N-terminal domain/Eukaryotic DNA topoisomerase I, catalytic core
VTVALDEDQRGADRCLVHHCVPGLRRTGGAGKFAYLDAHGCQVRDAATLERIRGLAIPPAWTSVWIAPDPNAHLQATGIDSRGRKQYRYHPAWREDRDHIKFEDMLAFARAQPRLRRRVESALEDANDPLGHRRVLALALRLLDVGLLRVGSDRYARENHHYGLTTLCQHEVIVGPDDSPASPGSRHRLAGSRTGAGQHSGDRTPLLHRPQDGRSVRRMTRDVRVPAPGRFLARARSNRAPRHRVARAVGAPEQRF